MIEVIERKELPIAEVICPNCGSKLRYSNVDLLYREHHPSNVSSFFLVCPVCGVQIDAHRITNPR